MAAPAETQGVTAAMAAKRKKKSKATEKPTAETPATASAIPALDQALQRAFQHHQAGQLKQAELAYRQVLQLDANQPNALRNLGAMLRQRGELEESAQLTGRAVQQNPNDASLLGNYANVLRDLRRFGEAQAVLQRALELEPANQSLLVNLAICCNRAGDFGQTQRLLKPLAERGEANADAWLELGNALHGLQRLDEAVECWRRGAAASHGEQKLITSLNLAQTLCEQKRFEAAERLAQPLLEEFGDRSNLHYALGVIQRGQNRLGPALDHYQRALELQPDYPICLNTYGLLLRDLGRVNAARECFEKALACKGDFAEAMNNLGSVLKDVGRAEEGVQWLRKASDGLPDNPVIHSNLLFTLCGYHLANAEQRLTEAKRYGERYATAPFERWKDRVPAPDPKRRLRVGLVSPDFCRHAVSYFIEPLLEHLDRKQLDIVAYHCGQHVDDYTQRLQGKADHWRHIHGQPLEEQIQTVLRDEIDVLIDLAGHTAGNGLPLLAHKPAPIQATYLGYYATTGLEQVDYWLTDGVLHPPGHRDLATEQHWRLGRCYVSFRPIPEAPAVVDPPLLRNGYATFGSFNQSRKITRRTAEHWMEVLQAVPYSKLLLKSKNLGEPEEEERVRQLFLQLGLPPERLEIRGHAATLVEHLASYGDVDIALDTWPYTGCTTTADALWMGVPVLTVAGDSMVTRQAASLLVALGEAQWVCADGTQMARQAQALLNDPQQLKERRQSQRERMARSELHDPATLARAFEKSFRLWWERWLVQQGWGEGLTWREAEISQPTIQGLSHSTALKVPLKRGTFSPGERESLEANGTLFVEIDSLKPMGVNLELFRRRMRGETLAAWYPHADQETWDTDHGWWQSVVPQLIWEAI